MRATETAATGLTHNWARDLLTSFYASLDYSRMPGDMARRVPRSTAFVALLDRIMSSPEQISQAALLNLHGAEGLRRNERLVAFIVAHLQIRWDGRAGVEHSAESAARTALDGSKDEAWHGDLAAFEAALAASTKPLAPRSMKAYVTAARDLLASAGVERSDQLTQRHLNAWLRRRPGRTNDVLRFLRWLDVGGGSALTARSRPKSKARARERAVLKTAGELLSRLASCQEVREGRALLARAISTVHGVSLERVLAIRQRHVISNDKGTDLQIDNATVKLSPTLSAAFTRFYHRVGDMPFGGRSGIAPLSPDGTRHHVGRTRSQPPRVLSGKAQAGTETLLPSRLRQPSDPSLVSADQTTEHEK